MDINPDHFSVIISMQKEYRFLPNNTVMAVVGVGLTMIPLTRWLEPSTRLHLAFKFRIGYANRLVERQDPQTVVFRQKISTVGTQRRRLLRNTYAGMDAHIKDKNIIDAVSDFEVSPHVTD